VRLSALVGRQGQVRLVDDSSERFWICIVSFDERGDVCSEGDYAAIDVSPDLSLSGRSAKKHSTWFEP
jgi:hypothetical protein